MWARNKTLALIFCGVLLLSIFNNPPQSLTVSHFWAGVLLGGLVTVWMKFKSLVDVLVRIWFEKEVLIEQLRNVAKNRVLFGREAVAYAEEHGLELKLHPRVQDQLHQKTWPTEDAWEFTFRDAPSRSLLWIDVEANDEEETTEEIPIEMWNDWGFYPPIILSVLWLSSIAVQFSPTGSHKENWTLVLQSPRFFLTGVLPVVALWMFTWIRHRKETIHFPDTPKEHDS